MKKLLLIFMIIGSLFADEIVVKIPLDIDALPNNGLVIDSAGNTYTMKYANLKLSMVGCNNPRIFFESILIADNIPAGIIGIHKTITVRQTYVSECGDPNPQITVRLYFSSQATGLGVPASDFNGGQSSLAPLIITNVNAVRGYFTKMP